MLRICKSFCFCSVCYPVDMSIEAEQHWRRERLQDLVSEVGGKASCGRMLGFRDGAYIGQMLGGIRPVTEKFIDRVHELPGRSRWFAHKSDAAPKIAAERVVELTAATCTEWLGSYIGAADTLTRSQIAPLLISLVDAPDRASELGARLQATLAMSPGYAPPALSGPGTTFAPPPNLPAVRHTPPEPKADALDACVEHLAKALASAGPLQRQQANQALQMLANRPDDWRTVAALLRPLVTQM